MAWEANTQPTGWNSGYWVWKFTITVPAELKQVGILTELDVDGMETWVDFFSADPGDPMEDGWNDPNDYWLAEWYCDGTTPGRYGFSDHIDLVAAGTLWCIAAALDTTTGVPGPTPPSWTPPDAPGSLIAANGTILGTPLGGPPFEGSAGVDLYVMATDPITDTYQRRMYHVTSTPGSLEQIGVLEEPTAHWYEATYEYGNGDFQGNYWVTDEFAGDTFTLSGGEYHTYPRWANKSRSAMMPRQSQVVMIFGSQTVERGVINSNTNGEVVELDTIFYATYQDGSGNNIDWALFDKDDPNILYGTTENGIWKIDITENPATLVTVAAFTTAQNVLYNSSAGDNFSSGPVIVGQRSNGDIVTSPRGDSDAHHMGAVHTWARDGSGLISEHYLGGRGVWEDFSPYAVALLDDDTVLVAWPRYKKPFTTHHQTDQDWPRDHYTDLFSVPILPSYRSVVYEALPDRDRLFTDGTAGLWSTMGQRFVGLLTEYLAPDTAVPPHDGVGVSLKDHVEDWDDNQYVYYSGYLPLLPGDHVRASVWIYPDPLGVLTPLVWGDFQIYDADGDENSFYSYDDDGFQVGNDLTLVPGEWNELVMEADVPGSWPFEVKMDSVYMAFLRFQHGSGDRWYSDMSVTVTGHLPADRVLIDTLAWPVPDIDQSGDFTVRMLQLVNGWPTRHAPAVLADDAGDSRVHWE